MTPLEKARLEESLRPPAAPAAPHPPAPPAKRGSPATVVLGLLGLLALFGGLFAFGFMPRARREEELAREVREVRDRVPEARVVLVRKSPAVSTVTLPGTARAQLETPLYARVNGYLKRFVVDIGDRVKKGQLVAEIESPEIDQQLRQARAGLGVAQASLAQSQANLELAKVAAKRWATLAKEHAVSQQEADEKQSALQAREADVQAARAAVLAQEANVKRLEELQSFEQILAPFDGTVTSRTVDVGTLVSEGSTTSSRELFRVAQTDTLRLFVHVPESLLPSIKVGLGAKVKFDAFGEREFTGAVSRDAHAVDVSSRTLLTEISVPNPDGLLVAGLYAQVTLEFKRASPPLLMPSNALVVRAQGTFVARVDKDSAVHYVPVQVGRDYGTEIEILSGLAEGDEIMVNPTTDVPEGHKVRPLHEK